MYLGFCFYSGVERPTDQETTAIEKIVLIGSLAGWGRGTPFHEGLHGEAPGLVRRQRERGKSLGKSLCCVFCEKGKARQSEQTWHCLNNFRRLWAVGVVSSCQTPGSGVI